MNKGYVILRESIHIAPCLSKKTMNCLDGAVIKDLGHKATCCGKCAISCESETRYHSNAAAISYVAHPQCIPTVQNSCASRRLSMKPLSKPFALEACWYFPCLCCFVGWAVSCFLVPTGTKVNLLRNLGYFSKSANL